MAITYEGANSTPFTTSTASWSFTPDAGVAADDWFVVMVAHRDNTSITSVGGTALGSLTVAVNKAVLTTGDRHLTVFLWKATSSSTSAVAMVMSAATVGSVAWARFRGVDTTSPLNVTSTANHANPTPNVVPSITTTVANAFVVGGLTVGSSSNSVTVPGTWTIRATASQAVGAVATKGIQASAGATGTVSFGTTPATALNTLGWQLALRPAAAVASPSLTYNVLGAVTDSGASVRARCADTASIRLKVATNSGLTTGVVFSSSQSVDSDGTAGVPVTGLSPDTAYYYGVEMTGPGGTVTSAAFGPFTTWPTPGTPESFSFAFGSCHSYAETTSSAAFTRISARNPRLFFHLGDFHYADNTSSSQASHLNDLATQINQLSGLRTLMANVPTVYSKSDHDSGDNGSFPGPQTPGNRGAYLQTFPTYTRPDTNGLYQSFVLGRIRFIVLDTRYFAAEDGSTRLGATQKAWLFDELVQSEPVKIIVQEGTWLDDRPTVLGDDTWDWFNAERTEIGNFIVSDAVGKVSMIHGDQHALSADDGSNNPWGGFPTMCAAPFGQWASVKTQNPATDWSQGIWAPESPAVQQYGFVNVTDNGSTISLAYTGYDSSNTSRITMTVTADTPTTGTLSGTLPKMTGTATGAVVIAATLAATLPKVTGATSGVVRVAGTTAGALPTVTGSLSGPVVVGGATAGTLPSVTGSLAGTVVEASAGTLAGTLPRITGSASGSVTVTGSLTGTLPVLTGTTAGGVRYTGAPSGTLPAIRGSITSADVVAGTLASTLPAITGTATGQQTITGTIAGELPTVEGTIAGQVRIGGTLTATLPRLAGHITGTSESVVILGILAGVLPALRGSISDGPDDVELAILRGPYGTTFTVGSPYGTTFTVSSARR